MNTLEREFLNASIEFSESEAREREAQRQRELDAAQKLAQSEKQRAEEQTRTAGQLHRRALYLSGAFVIAIIMALSALFFGAQARQSAVDAQAESRIAHRVNLQHLPSVTSMLILNVVFCWHYMLRKYPTRWRRKTHSMIPF